MANVIEIVFRGVDHVSGETQKINRSFLNVAAIARRMGVAFTATFAARHFIQAADTMRVLENRLRLVTDSAESLGNVQDRLFRISQQTFSSYEGVVNVFARVARNADTLGVSQERLLTVTRAINQALQISGASAQEASAGLIQLSQGLASGTLRGDELRSVMEQMPRLAQAIADGMGVTIGQLRQLGAEGKITAETVIRALESQAGALQREFSQMRPTVGQAMQRLKNSMLEFIGFVDDATHASGGLARAISAIAVAIDSITPGRMEALQLQLTDAENRLRTLAQIDDAIQSAATRQRRAAAQAEVDALRAGLERARDEAIGLRPVPQIQLDTLDGGPFETISVNVDRINNSLEEIRSRGTVLGDFADLSELEEANAVLARMNAEFEEFGSQIPTRISNVHVELDGLNETLQTIDVKRVGDGIVVSFDEAKKKADEMTVAAEEAARRIQNAFADFLFDPFEDGVRGMLKSFVDILRRMIAEALAARLFEKLFGKKEGESGGKNILGDIIGILVGGGKATGGFTTPGMAHPINEREPEFLITPQRAEVIPLSKAAAQGLVGRGGAPVTFNTTNNITTSVSPLELEAALARHDDMLLARFKQWQLDGGMT